MSEDFLSTLAAVIAAAAIQREIDQKAITDTLEEELEL